MQLQQMKDNLHMHMQQQVAAAQHQQQQQHFQQQHQQQQAMSSHPYQSSAYPPTMRHPGSAGGAYGGAASAPYSQSMQQFQPQPEHQHQQQQQQHALPQRQQQQQLMNAAYDNQVWTEYQDDLGRVYAAPKPVLFMNWTSVLLCAVAVIRTQVLPQRDHKCDAVGSPTPRHSALVIFRIQNSTAWRCTCA